MSIPDEIIQAAADVAAIGQCDVADISLDAVARHAGISRSTLFR